MINLAVRATALRKPAHRKNSSMSELHSLSIEGHTLVATEHNSNAAGTPIIFIHGILGSIFLQEPVLADVLAGYHWYSLSLPGHYPATLNQSFAPHDLTPEFMGRIMSEAVRQLTGGGPARLLGHSTGGYASLTVAHTAPELVESICLVDAFAFGRWGSPALRPGQLMANLPGIGRAVFTTYTRRTMGKPAIVKLFLRYASHNVQAMRQNPCYEETIRLTLRDSAQLDSASLYPYFHNMPHTNIIEWLRDITLPVTVLHGDCDPIIPPQHGEEMARALPNSRLQWFRQTGHLPYIENVEEFTRFVQAWAAQTPADKDA
jgi:pimeloyl-ACP methyl ester carboxylesterase